MGLSDKGYIQLAIRSGQYLDIDAIEIREGECKGRDKHSGKYIFEFIEDEDLRENTPIIGYLAYFELLNGFKKQIYFPHEKMLNHADKYSKAFSRSAYEKLQAGEIPKSDMWKYSSPWYSGFTGMALKTVLRQLLSKYGILSVELRTALDNDMAAINADGSVDYVDNSADYEQAPYTGIEVDQSTGEVIEPATEPEVLADDPASTFFD